MKAILLVGLGGLLGSIVRYKAGGWVLHLTTLEKFPYSTFAVNVAGCFAVGVLGGFTTFSAFGLDAFYLIRRGEWLTAFSYAGLSVIVGVAAVWLGFKLTGASFHHPPP